ncbi:MAG TPA: acetyl-CoA C-acyltransferase, partial [Allosphingosinicella sp.]|nr:acetyl-CoA C-acyltransferase [Allosphingosinicella sp.]
KADQAFARNLTVFDSSLGARFPNPKIESRFGADTMPETADNLAREYQISREECDLFALGSQQKYAKAAKHGFFQSEIHAVSVPQGRNKPDLAVADDEHPRPETTMDTLLKLKPIFPQGVTTAGNASGVNDGAAALIVATEGAARRNGLTPRARFLGTAVAGVPPRIMGIGPAPASEKLLKRLGLTITDMDVIELNEAFAAQGLAVMRQLGLADDDPRVNPNGGAIALGHPLGMSGARLILTATEELHRTGGRYALCTMCIGVGQGIATVIERV